MVTRQELTQYCEQLLAVDQISDYAPNGCQVQGKDAINKIVTGVTASLALITQAIEQQADALIVHHGYFWKNTSPCITGIQYARIKALMAHDINLFAYHLPLDAHPELGNNAQLAKLWGIDIAGMERVEKGGPAILFHGELMTPLHGRVLAEKIETTLSRKPLHIEGWAEKIKRIAWCSGGAQGLMDAALALNVDAYISGEVSEKTVHVARESGVHFYAAGHHATERYGVQALGEHLAQQFDIEHVFIDIDNPA